MANNPTDDVEEILKRTVSIARAYSLKYVTTHQLFCALLEHKDIGPFLNSYGVQTKIILTRFDHHFRSDPSLEKITDPKEEVRANNLIKIFERAKAQSILFEKNHIDVADILLAVLTDENQGTVFCKMLEQAGGNSQAIIDALTVHAQDPNNAKVFILSVQPQKLDKDAANSADKKEKMNSSQALTEFCTNLNELAKQGKIDPVIGRDKEVEKILQVLGRKNKQNVILVGESGTGKTAIVDGLVLKILAGEVPEQFRQATVYSLDMGGLVAGTRFRGDFEERLKLIIQAVTKDPNNILFIDEVHMIRGAGSSSENAMDAANILKPALASRQIRVIGATTDDEYRKHFEKDKALMRRFYKLDINEPSVEETKQILHGAVKHFENFHNVKYDSDALDLAVDLANKYMHNKRFPDKAFDIVDSAGSRIKLFDKSHTQISAQDIEKEVSMITKIPDINVKKDDSGKLKTLESNLKTKIFGQDKVVDELVNAVLVAKSGLREPEKPLLSALFRGQTGVGKTELAKQLANELGIAFVRFDMSEYQEKHSVSKFIGAPPGYVGFGEGQAGAGLLVNAIETNPHCVLLLDEIEKADPQVTNVLLQIMDYGMLTSSTGKTVSFRNVILIMSSNLGAKEMDKHPMGFGREDMNHDKDEDATKDFFAPEFRNRLDLIITFNRLNKEIMLQIVDKFIKETNKLLEPKLVKVVLTDAAKGYFVEQTVEKKLGARPLNTMISKEIKQPLSKLLLFGEIRPNTTVLVDLVDGRLVLTQQNDQEKPQDVLV